MIDRELKRTLGQMMHGVQVVGAAHDGVVRAYCSHWVSQVSFEEPIVLASVSLVVMPVLAGAQRRTGLELRSASAVSDAKQTLLCAYLSGVLLVGLALNSTLDWSWADPIAALVIAGVAVREGREAWRGEHCGCGG